MLFPALAQGNVGVNQGSSANSTGVQDAYAVILLAEETKKSALAQQNARELVAALTVRLADAKVALSVITLLELGHGAARADTAARRAKREQFIRELQIAMPVYPVTVAIAVRARLIDGENQARGIRLPISDLLIAATALELGHGVATGNIRHFGMVPGPLKISGQFLAKHEKALAKPFKQIGTRRVEQMAASVGRRT